VGEFPTSLVCNVPGNLIATVTARQRWAINTMLLGNFCIHKFIAWVQITNLRKRIINPWHGC
jgi:hypothetical protein